MPRLLKQGAEFVAGLAFAVMFGAFLLQVFARYVLDAPLGWTFEVCVVAYIWIVFWSCAFLLREHDHVAFNMFYQAARPAVRRWLLAAAMICLGAAFVASLPMTIDFVTFMKIDATPLLGLRFDWVYSVYILFMVAVIVRAGLLLYRLFGPRWRDAVGEGGGAESTL